MTTSLLCLALGTRTTVSPCCELTELVRFRMVALRAEVAVVVVVVVVVAVVVVVVEGIVVMIVVVVAIVVVVVVKSILK